VPVENLELRTKLLHEAGRGWKLRRCFFRGDAVSLHLPGRDLLHHRLRRGEEQIDVTARYILQGRRGAAIRDVVDGDFRLLRKQGCGEVAGGADAGMRHLDHLGLHIGEQLLGRVGLQRLAADQHQRIVVDEDDGREVLLGIERQIVVERDIGRNLQIVQEQRMAVRRRARDPAGGDGGAAAAHILHDEILPELLRQYRRQHARELVGRTTRGIRHDQGDDAARILLCRAGQRPGEKTENCRCNTDDTPHRTLLLV
jgi:hypothetical protein